MLGRSLLELPNKNSRFAEMQNNIRLIRTFKGMSRDDVAKKVLNRWGKPVSRRYVCQIENATNLTADTVRAFAEALSVQPNMIIQKGLKIAAK